MSEPKIFAEYADKYQMKYVMESIMIVTEILTNDLCVPNALQAPLKYVDQI